jgi:transcriptional regulator with XRE-family HTH domain
LSASEASYKTSEAILRLTNTPAVTGGETVLIWTVTLEGEDASGMAVVVGGASPGAVPETMIEDTTTSSEESFSELFRKAEQSPEFWVETAIIDFTEELTRAMQRGGVSRADLARRLKTSPAYVTKVLRGEANFTMKTMVRLAQALGCELYFKLTPTPTRSVTGQHAQTEADQLTERVVLNEASGPA